MLLRIKVQIIGYAQECLLPLIIALTLLGFDCKSRWVDSLLADCSPNTNNNFNCQALNTIEKLFLDDLITNWFNIQFCICRVYYFNISNMLQIKYSGFNCWFVFIRFCEYFQNPIGTQSLTIMYQLQKYPYLESTHHSSLIFAFIHPQIGQLPIVSQKDKYSSQTNNSLTIPNYFDSHTNYLVTKQSTKHIQFGSKNQLYIVLTVYYIRQYSSYNIITKFSHKIFKMTSYSLLESPEKHFSHNRNLPTTIPKRSLERQFSFKSPERNRLDFNTPNNQSKDTWESKLLDKNRKVIDLQSHVQKILRNNRELVEENESMKSLILMQRNQIDSLRIEGSRNLDMILVRELQNKNFQHRVEVQKLLSEITRLQNQLILVQDAKNFEIDGIRNELSKIKYINLEDLKRSRHQISDSYQLQMKKLGDIIQLKEDEIQKLVQAARREKQLLFQQLIQIKSEFKHMMALKNNELSELKFGYESELARVEREYKQNQETQAQAHDAVLRRMGRQLNERLGDIERLNEQIRNNNAQHSQLFKQLNCDKKKFESELDAQMNDAKIRIKEQKQKMDSMIKRTIQNINSANEQKQKSMQNQIQLLKQLVCDRKQEIQNQKNTISTQKQNYKNQIQDLQKQNKHLRSRLEQITKDNLSSLESLKIKMAELHQSDITGLSHIHETRITSLSQELIEKNKQLDQMKKRLHTQMQGKLHLRKQYQLQVSRLKSKIMDLRIQINAVQIEMKDNITSMRSQMDVTSQGLIRDRQTKSRTIKSYQDQMRKLRQTIDSKDDELKIVEENAAKKQQYFKNQTQTQSQKVNNLKRQLEEKQKRKQKELEFKEQQIRKNRKQIEQLKNQLNQQGQQKKKIIKQLNQRNQQIQEKLNLARKQLQTLRSRIASLEHDLNLARGDVETVRFEQQAAANDQRAKIKQSISKTHSGFKDYYQSRIKDLQNDKNQLQTINSAQSQQIDQLVVKYRQLEEALKSMIDSQKRLSDLQNKIVHLGLDNNLVKNLGQIIKRPFH